MKEIMSYWSNVIQNKQTDMYYNRKRNLYKKRDVQIKTIQLNVFKHNVILLQRRNIINCTVQFSFTLQDGDKIYIEEERIDMKHILQEGNLKITEQASTFEIEKVKLNNKQNVAVHENSLVRNSYDRLAAVKYAELWWNSNNPDFPIFEVDCTNYVSQCLLAGGAPMQGAPVRERGWWQQNNKWSFSWSVAHSLRWFLSSSKSGLKGQSVENAHELMPGDIICYDFEGDGKWNHNTIVTAKDENDEPLVNAHTNNSRLRYWTYEDSYAWTPQCKYKFFRIELS